MPSKTFLTTMLALATTISQVSAGDWWVIGYQQNFCNSADKGDTNYNWKGSGSGCHNFGTSDRGCVFSTTGNGGDESAVACGARSQPRSILSMDYEEGLSNEGNGCVFFSREDCQGASEDVYLSSEIDHCYEFQSAKMSFRCP